MQRREGKVVRNPSALLMEIDYTVGGKAYGSNLFVSGTMEGRELNGQETAFSAFSASWFVNFPKGTNHDLNDNSE